MVYQTFRAPLGTDVQGPGVVSGTCRLECEGGWFAILNYMDAPPTVHIFRREGWRSNACCGDTLKRTSCTISPFDPRIRSSLTNGLVAFSWQSRWTRPTSLVVVTLIVDRRRAGAVGMVHRKHGLSCVKEYYFLCRYIEESRPCSHKFTDDVQC